MEWTARRDRRGAGFGRSRHDSARAERVERRFTPTRARSSTSIPIRSFARSCSTSCSFPVRKDGDRPIDRRQRAAGAGGQGHGLPALLLEYRELFKLEGTYLDALPALHLPRDGRLHTSFSQTVAATGRLSSSDPNLQNIPIRRELGRDIRRGFVPLRRRAAPWPRTTRRSSCGCWPTSRAIPLSSRRFGPAATFRQTASIIFGVPLEMRSRRKCARVRRRSTSPRSTARGRTHCRRQLKIEFAEAQALHRDVFRAVSGHSRFLDCDDRATRASAGKSKRCSDGGATSRSCATGISTSAPSGSALAQNSPIQARRPISSRSP